MPLHFQRTIVLRWLGIALAVLAVGACDRTPDESASMPLDSPTEGELVAESRARQPGYALDQVNAPVEAGDATDVRIELIAESGYYDEQGVFIVDLLEQDYAYLAVLLETQDGRPVNGASLAFSLEGTSRLLQPEEVSPQATTDEAGIVQFAVVGGPMGVDRVRVEFREASAELRLNVISLEVAGFPRPPVVEGGIPWEDLMKARIRYQDMALHAEFPDVIAERAGQTVRLSGFMVPMEADLTQRRFLLTSNPPSCFFHIPGGPAGAVEVSASAGIEVSWDPMVLEGRFEPQRTSEDGVVYRLLDARLVIQ